jgi:hypothetical protein
MADFSAERHTRPSQPTPAKKQGITERFEPHIADRYVRVLFCDHDT